MKQSVVYIGVDVAKAYLDVAWAAASRRFPNDRNGHAALVVWIKQSAAPVQLICEAGGGYEQALLESLEQNNLEVTLVQAIRVRQYARAAGIFAKTDTIDAALTEHGRRYSLDDLHAFGSGALGVKVA
jgi:transposase